MAQASCYEVTGSKFSLFVISYFWRLGRVVFLDKNSSAHRYICILDTIKLVMATRINVWDMVLDMLQCKKSIECWFILDKYKFHPYDSYWDSQ